MTTGETTVPPRCVQCGRPLRRYRYRENEWANGREWGDYGDGLFCGLRCGFRWALRYAPAVMNRPAPKEPIL